MLKMSRPVLYMFLATLCIAIYLLATPPSPTHHTTRQKPVVTVQATNAQYRPEDYKAKFDGAVLVSRDAFKPLVERKSSALAAALAAAGNIPADFAGGDPNWSCTGSAEVDGVLQALIENKNTEEGVFLRQGDHWKNCVVSQVFEDGITLVGPGGEAKTIHVRQDEPDTQADNGNTPVQPQLNGPIGNGFSPANGQVVPGDSGSPLPPPTQTTQADDNNAG